MSSQSDRMKATDENTSLVQLALVEKNFASIALPLLHESLQITSFQQLAKVVRHKKKKLSKETEDTKNLSIRFVHLALSSHRVLADILPLPKVSRQFILPGLHKVQRSLLSNPSSRLLPTLSILSRSKFPHPLTIRSPTFSPNSLLYHNSRISRISV